MKNRVDEIDFDKYYAKYTTIEGDIEGEALETITYDKSTCSGWPVGQKLSGAGERLAWQAAVVCSRRWARGPALCGKPSPFPFFF